MFSELTQAEIVNGFVLIAVMHSDLGTHRKIGPVRLLTPAMVAGAIVPLFIDPVVTHGAGLAVELAGTAAGILGGLAALALISVYRSPRIGKPVSRATWPYALLWTLVIGARAAYSYGATHWFPVQIDQWCMAHHVTVAAITDGLIFMAVAMLLTRTLGLAARAVTLPRAIADSTVGVPWEAGSLSSSGARPDIRVATTAPGSSSSGMKCKMTASISAMGWDSGADRVAP